MAASARPAPSLGVPARPLRGDVVLDITDLVEDRIRPDAFCEEHYRTAGMQTLLEQVMRRFSRQPGAPGVFVLTQAMDGGKTHHVIAPRAASDADESFRASMVECYRNLAAHMPNDGMPVVMCTHQDAAVWADRALILWAAGLRVTAAWTIATETDSALKAGNSVQGTVLLVLRQQTGGETAFLDEVYPEVEREVRAQLDAMTARDEGEDPNFGDTDDQFAAYAAALRVLTRYARIEDLDVARELARPKKRGEPSPVEQVIADAVRVAADHLVPRGFDAHVWRTCGAR